MSQVLPFSCHFSVIGPSETVAHLPADPGFQHLPFTLLLELMGQWGVWLFHLSIRKTAQKQQNKLDFITRKCYHLAVISMLQDRVKLQLVRLLIETFSTDPSLSFLNSAVSNTITNSKSKECGPLQLHDLNPSTSCTKGNFAEHNT